MKNGRISYDHPDVIGATREVNVPGAVRAQRSIVLVVRGSFFEDISWYLKDENEFVRQINRCKWLFQTKESAKFRGGKMSDE